MPISKGIPSGLHQAARSGVKYAKFRAVANERGKMLARAIATGETQPGFRVISGKVKEPIDVRFPYQSGSKYVKPRGDLSLAGSKSVRTRSRNLIKPQ